MKKVKVIPAPHAPLSRQPVTLRPRHTLGSPVENQHPRVPVLLWFGTAETGVAPFSQGRDTRDCVSSRTNGEPRLTERRCVALFLYAACNMVSAWRWPPSLRKMMRIWTSPHGRFWHIMLPDRKSLPNLSTPLRLQLLAHTHLLTASTNPHHGTFHIYCTRPLALPCLWALSPLSNLFLP